MVTPTAWRWKDTWKWKILCLVCRSESYCIVKLGVEREAIFLCCHFRDSNLTGWSILITKILGPSVHFTTLKVTIFSAFRWLLYFLLHQKMCFVQEWLKAKFKNKIVVRRCSLELLPMKDPQQPLSIIRMLSLWCHADMNIYNHPPILRNRNMRDLVYDPLKKHIMPFYHTLICFFVVWLKVWNILARIIIKCRAFSACLKHCFPFEVLMLMSQLTPYPSTLHTCMAGLPCVIMNYEKTNKLMFVH